MDKVYVSQASDTEGLSYSTSLSYCRTQCMDERPNCQTYTVFGPDFDGEGKNTCVLNYGPQFPRILPIGATGFASAFRDCP